MARYHAASNRRRMIPRRILLLVLAIVILFAAGAVVVRQRYAQDLNPVSSNQTTQLFSVAMGSSVKQIAKNLQNKHLIRSAWAMELYVHSKELTDKLQAGTYAFSPSQSTGEIVTTLTHGRVSTKLVTILPGARLDQVRATLINDGFAPKNVDAALDPAQYADLPVLAFKPGNINSLEGLLWPDSFQKAADTSPALIIKESLLAMGEHLTPDVQAGFAAQGLTTYQGLILASIVTQEVNKPTDQAMAAQVFLLRLKNGTMLGSDVTARYGSIAAGRAPDLSYDSAYNTLKHNGLPPTPISTVTASSLNATTHPAGTDFLFFVAGDDGTTYFSRTFQEHEALSEKYCHRLCGR